MPLDTATLVKQYEERIRKELYAQSAAASPEARSAESSFKHYSSENYLTFKRELLPKKLNLYEQLCRWSEKTLKIAPPVSARKQLVDDITACHLDITPEGAQSFAILIPFIIMLVGSVLGYVIPNAFTAEGSPPVFFFVFFFFIIGLSLMLVFMKLPQQFAKTWRLAASNQMILSIFYLVTYLRHTSNLENAVRFAAEHLTGPLAFDFKRLLWRVENQKYQSLSEGLDIYLLSWQKTNPEFVEALHLIESSLLESTEARRLALLDK